MSERLPRTVVVLGLVSLCMDTSSELIHSLLPALLVAGLGASPLVLGLIEGLAEACASLTKVFAGAISDRSGRRKPLILAGYGLAAVAKPLFPLAGGAGTVLLARVVDRLGKGIRGAPRDALIADVTPGSLRGAAYGLRQSLDTVGAVAGPLAATALMYLLANDVRAVMWVAVLPAAAAVLLVMSGVKEPARLRAPVSGNGAGRSTLQLRPRELRALPPALWGALGFAALLSLARFSEAFLLLRGSDLGMAAADVPLLLVAMNLAYTGSAYPLGKLSDRLPRSRLLGPGLVLLVLADAVLAFSTNAAGALCGAIFWGLHLGATQGVLTALVADHAPVALRGTAFGLLHLVTGVALLVASVIAGAVWSAWDAPVTFLCGGAVAVLALLPVPWLHRQAVAR
jgi:MFS family permease